MVANTMLSNICAQTVSHRALIYILLTQRNPADVGTYGNPDMACLVSVSKCNERDKLLEKSSRKDRWGENEKIKPRMVGKFC